MSILLSLEKQPLSLLLRKIQLPLHRGALCSRCLDLRIKRTGGASPSPTNITLAMRGFHPRSGFHLVRDFIRHRRISSALAPAPSSICASRSICCYATRYICRTANSICASRDVFSPSLCEDFIHEVDFISSEISSVIDGFHWR